ncbi:hypothetical protein TcCL_NonESM09302 [Trypanosoma cruzi]|nr:hypothetical protein TcCL_NonESM09302 [Trypanosoma cruzi]
MQSGRIPGKKIHDHWHRSCNQMVLPQSSPDAVKDTQGPRHRTKWWRYIQRPSSAPKDKLLTWKRGGGFAVRQHSKRRSFLTWVGIAQQAAAPSAHTTHTKRTNKEVRWRHSDTGDKSPRQLRGLFAHRRPVCNHAAVLQFVSLQEAGGWREGKKQRCGPHPYRLTVTPVTASRQVTCSKDCRTQQRSVPSLSHWGATPPTPSPVHSPPTRQGSNSGRCDACDEHAAAESHCRRHEQKGWLQDSKRRVSTPSNALASRRSTATETRGETP